MYFVSFVSLLFLTIALFKKIEILLYYHISEYINNMKVVYTSKLV